MQLAVEPSLNWSSRSSKNLPPPAEIATPVRMANQVPKFLRSYSRLQPADPEHSSLGVSAWDWAELRPDGLIAERQFQLLSSGPARHFSPVASTNSPFLLTTSFVFPYWAETIFHP